MRLRSITSGALGLGLLLLGTAASAVDPGCRLIRGAATPDTADDVQVCRQDTWMHGAGSRLDNLSAAQGTIPSWNTTQPTATLQDGGSGYAAVRFVEIFLNDDARVKPTFRGSYTGTLDNFAVTMYLASPAYQTAGVAFPLSFMLTVDGETVMDRTALDAQVQVPITPVTDQYGYIKFAFTNMYNALDTLGLENAADTQHTISFHLISNYWVDGNSVILYDATETPTGNIFNIETNKLSPFTKIDTTA